MFTSPIKIEKKIQFFISFILNYLSGIGYKNGRNFQSLNFYQ